MLRVLALFAVLIVTAYAAILLGKLQPLPKRLAMLHLMDCELPCWIGIVPGKTTFQQARDRVWEVYGQLLKGQDKSQLFSDPQHITLDEEGRFLSSIVWFTDKNDVVDAIDFYFWNSLTASQELYPLVTKPISVLMSSTTGNYTLIYGSGQTYVASLNGFWGLCQVHLTSLKLFVPRPMSEVSNNSGYSHMPWRSFRHFERFTGCQ